MNSFATIWSIGTNGSSGDRLVKLCKMVKLDKVVIKVNNGFRDIMVKWTK